jgi:hypothetical protein
MARLGGTYRVLYSVTATNLNNTHPGQSLHSLWIVVPRCGHGACNAALKIPLKTGDASGKLVKAGPTFHGGLTDASLGTCGNSDNPPQDSAVIHLRVIRAALREGAWTAVRFEGTFREYFPPRGFCGAGFMEADVHGFLTPG